MLPHSDKTDKVFDVRYDGFVAGPSVEFRYPQRKEIGDRFGALPNRLPSGRA